MSPPLSNNFRNEKQQAFFACRFSIIILLVCVLLGAFNTPHIEARSIFAITDHGYGSNEDKISAYQIQGNQVELQIHHEPADHGTGAYSGPVGLASDPDSGYLFVTYEGLGGVELIQTKSMTNELFISVPGASNLAGIVFDSSRQKLYAVDRLTNNFFVLLWDPLEPSLTLEGGYPLALSHTTSAAGLALDEIEGLLYVASIGGSVGHSGVSNFVDYYETQNWTYQGSIEIAVDGNPRIAMGITAYNDGAGSKYLYSGGYGFSNFHNYLVRTDLNYPDDPNASVEYDAGAMVTGLAADQNTQLLYTTLSDNSVVVLDTSNWPPVITDIETDGVSGPADICIGGVDYKPPLIPIGKVTDDSEPNYCVAPGDHITYTICYTPDQDDHTNVAIIDYLPWDVDFVRAEPNDGYYHSGYHICYWYFEELPGAHPNDPNICFQVEVKVNQHANPKGFIDNYVEMESDTSFSFAQKSVPVCCWDGDIIYVNDDARGDNNGISWDNAYTDLQDALERARQGCGYEIWVARGTYIPSNTLERSAAFEMISGVALYGGFLGNEISRDQRNYHNSKTILSGKIDPTGINNSYTVVLAENVDESAVLDGFIIEGAASEGIRCESAHPLIANCVISDNGINGLNCRYSDAILANCVIKNNGSDGIEFYGNNSPTIMNCKIYGNTRHGIYSRYSWPTLKNSWIHHNGSDNNGCGVYIESSSHLASLQNNTIAYNADTGISKINGGDVVIFNCILWGNDNHDNHIQLQNCWASYSCIYDHANPGGSCIPDIYGNISCAPLFVYDNPWYHDLHLAADSPCIDLGDPSLDYSLETDIDGDPRKYGLNVDMGADEYACDDILNPVDFNLDAIVNQWEYNDVAHAWLSEPADPNWNGICDLDNNNFINIVDLTLLAQDWLWQPCWTHIDN